METWQILVTVGVPSGIFGFAVWLIERKIEQHERKRTEEAKKRENIEAQREKSREELQICIYETSLAAIALGEATAKAVQRIPDAHCNGDMHAGLGLRLQGQTRPAGSRFSLWNQVHYRMRGEYYYEVQ